MHPDRQLGLLWAAAAVGLVALAPLGPVLAAVLPACPFRAAFGLPCVSCGATRAALALARGDLATALAFNPLAALAWGGVVGGGVAAGLAALAGRGVRQPSRAQVRWLRLLVPGAAAANWIYLIRFPP